jgi:hypothetical protein
MPKLLAALLLVLINLVLVLIRDVHGDRGAYGLKT